MHIDPLLARLHALNLHGIAAHLSEIQDKTFLSTYLDWEEKIRTERSLHRRLTAARLGRFKPLSEFDWAWPNHIDRDAIEHLQGLDFMTNAINVILFGPNGVGKSMIACNVAYSAIMHGHTALFVTAAQLVSDLAAQESDRSLRLRLKYYAQPQLLIIDEVGYLPFTSRSADMLFQLISERYEKKSTLVTTNKAFSDWGEVFLSAACVVSMVDRLIHHSEIITIDAESYRLKEAHAKLQAVKVSKKAKAVKKTVS
jgi:DNA replication protein DnaC